jgi:hypothetical protein
MEAFFVHLKMYSVTKHRIDSNSRNFASTDLCIPSEMK